MWLNLSAIFKKLSYDPDVRAVILTGAGERAFTAGLDVQAASQGQLSSGSRPTDPARKANGLRRHIFEFQDCITAIEKCEKPVIAVLHGISTLSRLPHSVGNHSWVKEIALSARIFGSDEALQHGLVSRVYKDKKEAVSEALKLGELIATKSPVAVMGTKEIINYSRDRTIADGLNYTAVWNAAMLQTQDMKDAMLSGLQKKTAKFSKL
jgi:delta(3,5)-delta(2,4)-dienoyl-CoA isomerase